MATSRSVVSAHNPASASMDPVEPKLRLAPHTIVHLSVTIVETTSYINDLSHRKLNGRTGIQVRGIKRRHTNQSTNVHLIRAIQETPSA